MKRILWPMLALLAILAGSVHAASPILTAAPALCHQAATHGDAAGSCAAVSKAMMQQVAAHPDFQAAAKTYSLDTAQAALVRRADVPFSVVVIPIRGKDKELDQLYIYVGADEAIQRVAALNIRDDENGYRVISFKSGEGRLISGARFKDGKYVDTLQSDVGLSTDWACWQRCMSSRWTSMPDWVQWTCGQACGACIFAGQFWTCPVCAVCVGFWGGWCQGTCS